MDNHLTSCKTMEEAWRALMKADLLSGLLQVSSPETNGSITFKDGKIIAASVKEAALHGEDAFNRLASVRDATFRYVTPDELSAAARAPVNRSLPSADADRAEFFQESGILSQATNELPADKRRVLAVAQHLADDELFEEVAYPELRSAESLTESQRKALAALAIAGDAREFGQHTGVLEETGLLISDEQLWMLGEVLVSRSADAQKREFSTTDRQLHIDDAMQFKDFVEPQAPASFEESAPAPLAVPSFASDFAPNDTIATEELPGNQSQILPAAATEQSVLRRQKMGARYGRIAAPLAVAVLCVALYTVPAVLRNSSESTIESEMTEQETEYFVDQEIRDYSPRQRRRAFVLPEEAAGSAPAAPGGGAEDVAAPAPDALTEQSIESFEKQLAGKPDWLALRVQLIEFYKARKNYKRARELIVLGMKLPSATPAQRRQLWQLFRECQ